MRFVNLRTDLKSNIVKFFCLISILFFVSGCASTIHVKKSRPHNGENQKIIPAEDVEIVSAKKSLRVGEKLTYKITWLGMPVGTVTSHIKEITEVRGREAYYIELIAKTNAFCSAIYKIDDRFATYMDTETLLPLRHELKRREGRHRKDYIVEYDHKKNTATYNNLREKWVRTTNIPKGAQDPLSGVYFFRTQDAKVGTPIYIDINMNEKNYQVSGEIKKKAVVEVLGLGTFDAFQANPVAKLKGEIVKKGRAWGYVSCDESRVPLFGVVDVWVRLIGRVALTLTELR